MYGKNNERNKEIRKLREKGLTLPAIADWVSRKYGDVLSRQRIHQIASGYRPASNRKWYGALVESIKERDGYRCQWANLCDGKPKESKDLIVHHLDFDDRNNNVGNLITLCPKCHASFHSTNHINPKIRKNIVGKQTIVTCRYCGKEFGVLPSRKSTAKYCSRECYRLDHRRTLVCDVCGKEFSRRKSAITKGGNYCSVACRNKGVGDKISKTKRKIRHQKSKSIDKKITI